MSADYYAQLAAKHPNVIKDAEDAARERFFDSDTIEKAVWADLVFFADWLPESERWTLARTVARRAIATHG